MEVINNLCQATQRNLGSCFRSTLNRFASADSIVPNPANPQSFNRYSYSYNNPINFRDPSGHNPVCNSDGSICSDDPATIDPAARQRPVANSSSSPVIDLENYEMIYVGQYTFSSYIVAVEGEFSGAKVEIPGLSGMQATNNFLYGFGGVVMQGTGRLEDGSIIHVNNPQSVQWVRDGRAIIYDNGWKYQDTGMATNLDNAQALYAEFSLGYGAEVIPYYTVAAPSEFPTGTIIYSPELQPYTPSGGVFTVTDSGGAITGNRMDLFVGEGFSRSNNWFADAQPPFPPPGLGRPGAARKNASVFILVPKLVPYR